VDERFCETIVGKRKLKPAKKREHFALKIPPRTTVVCWKIATWHEGKGEVPIRECLVWDRDRRR
jgi:hypothetical protein